MLDRFPHLVPKLGIKQVKHDRNAAAGLQAVKLRQIGRLERLSKRRIGSCRRRRADELGRSQ